MKIGPGVSDLWRVENRLLPLTWPMAYTTACTTVQAVILCYYHVILVYKQSLVVETCNCRCVAISPYLAIVLWCISFSFKTHLFFKSFTSLGPFSVSLTAQLEHLTVRCVVGSGVSNVDKCGRLSQPSWLLGAR